MKILETIGKNDSDNMSVDDFLAKLDDLLVENTTPANGERYSIYCSVGRTREEAEQGRIRMRTQIQDILETASVSETVEKSLRDVLKLTRADESNQDFWNHQQDGLAVFVDSDSCRKISMSCDIDPTWSKSRYWHLAPLLQCAANAGAYWLLHLSQKSVNLYHGSHFGFSQISVPGLPKSFDESKAGLRNITGDDPTTEPLPPNRNDLSRFFEEVNDSVVKVLSGSDLPLVIAGVDHYLPLYETVNTYRNLFSESIKGTPEFLDNEEMNEMALSLLEDEFNRSQDEQFERIADLAESGKSVSGLKDVLCMAAQGRVKNLIAPCNETLWGTYNMENSEITELPAADIESRDLFQLAAEETLLHGGRIYFAPLKDMPNEAGICAELRY
ncbi:MAG: hypothetical protein P1V20_10275 [Verrucomicrobiales bacterium]|nr:hypothetical protein [Verrucomicrobiales bacterium]